MGQHCKLQKKVLKDLHTAYTQINMSFSFSNLHIAFPSCCQHDNNISCRFLRLSSKVTPSHCINVSMREMLGKEQYCHSQIWTLKLLIADELCAGMHLLPAGSHACVFPPFCHSHIPALTFALCMKALKLTDAWGVCVYMIVLALACRSIEIDFDISYKSFVLKMSTSWCLNIVEDLQPVQWKRHTVEHTLRPRQTAWRVKNMSFPIDLNTSVSAVSI